VESNVTIRKIIKGDITELQATVKRKLISLQHLISADRVTVQLITQVVSYYVCLSVYDVCVLWLN